MKKYNLGLLLYFEELSKWFFKKRKIVVGHILFLELLNLLFLLWSKNANILLTGSIYRWLSCLHNSGNLLKNANKCLLVLFFMPKYHLFNTRFCKWHFTNIPMHVQHQKLSRTIKAQQRLAGLVLTSKSLMQSIFLFVWHDAW